MGVPTLVTSNVDASEVRFLLSPDFQLLSLTVSAAPQDMLPWDDVFWVSLMGKLSVLVATWPWQWALSWYSVALRKNIQNPNAVIIVIHRALPLPCIYGLNLGAC